jgi:hypothetical protein
MAGMLSCLLAFLAFILALPGRDSIYHFDLVYRVLPIYRCTLIMNLVFLGVATCVYVFRRYKVNYIFIFDFNPRLKLNQFQFFKMFLVL